MKLKIFTAIGLTAMMYLAAGLGGGVAFAENIDPDEDGSQFAYGENIGWLNFEPNQGPGVTVSDSNLAGYIWAENIGWINLSPASYGGVFNDGNGVLSGYAWSENAGWINFAPVGGGVFIDACGDFNGLAWGENIGWISFGSDGAVFYRLTSEWVSPIDTIAPETLPDIEILEWFNTDVNLTLLATDCGSGPNEVHYTLNGGDEVVTAGSSASLNITGDGVHTLTFFSVDVDGNIEAVSEVIIQIDTTPPVISIANPADGATYYVDEIILADFIVSDGGSGIDTLTSTVPNGSLIDTATTGAKTFSVSASDNASNSNTVSHSYTVTLGGNINPCDDGSQYAYGENIGWLNFQPNKGPGVTVSDSNLAGYIWAENIGWINLSPSNYGGVYNNGAGNLSGYAWGENVGWINFSPNYGGVTIDADGDFDGWAWGENIGWIHFNSTSPVAYKVQVCVANFDDLANFVDDWLESGPGLAGDLSGNSEVDFLDYSIFASYWLNYCPDGWPLK